MRILSQREQYPHRMAALNFNHIEDNLYWAKGDHHNYLINPPANGVSNRTRNRPGPDDAFLLHTRPTNTDDSLGQRPRIWDYHSAHPSMEEAQAAAEQHHAGGGDGGH